MEFHPGVKGFYHVLSVSEVVQFIPIWMLGITEYVYLWLSFWSSWRAWTWAETTCSSNMESTRRSNPKVYHYQPPTALAPGEMYKKNIRKTGRGPFQRSQIIYEYIIPVDFVPDLHNQINRCDVYFAATSYPIRWNYYYSYWLYINQINPR